jgi:YebC/PmpR family DNA-binding regulatory protein
MSGHNKWSSIKHRKGAQDAKRGKIFTKIIREITVAVKEGGKDPDINNRLRTALEKARGANMPKDTLQNAIKRGAGELSGVNYESFSYEGYGPGGVAVMVDILTDNKNRTAADVRHTFAKHGGNLGENGCVGWLFDRKGSITIKSEGLDEDTLMDIVLEAGADDIVNNDDEFEVLTEPSSLENVKKALTEKGIEYESAELTMIPQNTVKLDGKDAAKMLKLIDDLEDNDDVQNVYSNFEIDDEVLEQLAE